MNIYTLHWQMKKDPDAVFHHRAYADKDAAKAEVLRLTGAPVEWKQTTDLMAEADTGRMRWTLTQFTVEYPINIYILTIGEYDDYDAFRVAGVFTTLDGAKKVGDRLHEPDEQFGWQQGDDGGWRNREFYGACIMPVFQLDQEGPWDGYAPGGRYVNAPEGT